MSSSSNAAILIVCAFAVVAAPALAQPAESASTVESAPSPADVAAAKAQFAEGVDLRASGDLQGALKRFRAAYGFVPTPITGLEVGRTLAQMGHPAEARAVLLEAANMPKRPGESEKATQARADAAKLAAELDAKVATLDVRSDADVESVTVDDKPVADGARGAVVVDPGHHVVAVRTRDGRTGHAEIDAAAGDRKEVHVTPSASGGSKTRLHVSPVAWVGFGVAGVGLLVGAVTGGGAFATASSVKRDCPNGLCPPSAHGTLNASVALGTTSTVAFIVAGAGAAVGIVGLLLSKRVPIAESATIVVGPGTVGFEGRF